MCQRADHHAGVTQRAWWKVLILEELDDWAGHQSPASAASNASRALQTLTIALYSGEFLGSSTVMPPLEHATASLATGGLSAFGALALGFSAAGLAGVGFSAGTSSPSASTS